MDDFNPARQSADRLRTAAHPDPHCDGEADECEVVIEIIEAPAVVAKPERRYAGIRTVTPFRGMFAVRDALMKDLDDRPDRLDRERVPAGDRFGCRYELYLTDSRTERMKTRWRIELAIRLAHRLSVDS